MWTKFCQRVKKPVKKFSVIAKENSEQIRQYQEIASELIGVYKEHNFVHELDSQIPETIVAKLPVRLCGRWAKFIEGKPRSSTRQWFRNWLGNEAKISESKRRWKTLVTLGLGCLQERQEGILHSLEMWQRSVRFTSVTTRYKSAKSLRERGQARKRTSWVNTTSAYLVCYQVIA